MSEGFGKHEMPLVEPLHTTEIKGGEVIEVTQSPRNLNHERSKTQGHSNQNLDRESVTKLLILRAMRAIKKKFQSLD